MASQEDIIDCTVENRMLQCAVKQLKQEKEEEACNAKNLVKEVKDWKVKLKEKESVYEKLSNNY